MSAETETPRYLITTAAQARVDELLQEIARCPGFRVESVVTRADGGATIKMAVSALRRNFLPAYDANGELIPPVPEPRHVIGVSPEGVRE